MTTRPRVFIVGAGFAGFHCARELERLLGPQEAELILASPVDYMLYSPMLPQVAAGVITPQAATVSLRRALRRTLRAPCSITGIDLDGRACVAQAVTGEVHTVTWDYLVLCPGAVTRTFGTPGGEQHGRGMKTLAQATHLHDHVLAELELGNAVGDEARRAAHCTFVVAADWLMHSVLGDDFTRLGLPDPMPDTLAGQEPAGQYLSSDDARQTTARILARDQGGWLT